MIHMPMQLADGTAISAASPFTSTHLNQEKAKAMKTTAVAIMLAVLLTAPFAEAQGTGTFELEYNLVLGAYPDEGMFAMNLTAYLFDGEHASSFWAAPNKTMGTLQIASIS